MNDDDLDRLVRDADPYRNDLVGLLGGADQILLEEIMSTPKLESVPTAPAKTPRRGLGRRLVGAVAAAAVVTGVIGASALLRDRSDGVRDWAGPLGLPNTATGGDPALDLKAAQSHPRLLIEEAGWKVTTVYGFAAAEGTIGFTNGKRQLQMNWYPASQYDGYYQDRLSVSEPAPTTVAGVEASIFTYSGTDHAAMRKARDSAFVELRADGMDRAAFDALLTRIVQVTPEQFLAALPPEVVTPSKVTDAAAKVLADIPIPPGFDAASIDVAGANDPYQFGAGVTSQITCAWIAEWIRADGAGDDAAVDKAASALRSSHQWKVLKDMRDEGDWSEVVWEYADKVAGGTVPRGYEDGIGCRSGGGGGPVGTGHPGSCFDHRADAWWSRSSGMGRTLSMI